MNAPTNEASAENNKNGNGSAPDKALPADQRLAPGAPHDGSPVLANQSHGGEIPEAKLNNGQDHNDPNHHDPHAAHGDDENVIPHDLPRPSRKSLLLLAGAFVVLFVALFLVGLIPDYLNKRKTDADAQARASDVPIVNTTQPVVTSTSKDIILPCDVRAYASTMLYPRSTGYLKKWYYDIQSRVKAGTLLAEIDTPDVDAELAQSEATLQQNEAAVQVAQANKTLADQTLDQYVKARKGDPGSVTEEDFNTRVSNQAQAAAALKQAQANVVAAQADVQRMQVMVGVGFEKIVAPFDGVITYRGYDNGALLNPSMTGPGQEIFQIQQTDPLRVFVSVPQAYASLMTIGQPTYLKVRNYGEREFTGYIARSTAAVDESTRTMQFELDFPNKDNALYPGMYGQARLPIVQTHPLMTIPSSALVFNADGTQVAVVKDNKAHFQKISVGRDLGTQLEVVDGLTPDDVVVSNPGERLTDGVEVHVANQQGAAPDQNKPQGEKLAEKS